MKQSPVSPEARASVRAGFRQLRPFFYTYRRRLILGFVALLAVDFLQLSIPRVIKRAVDGLQAGTATQSGLLQYGLVIVLLALGIALFRFGWRYCLLGFSRLVERDIRERFFAHLLTLDRGFFQRRSTGEIMALSSNDLAAVQLACGMGLVAFVDAVVMSVAALGFMLYIQPLLTLAAVAPMPVLALLTRLLSARLHHRFQKVQEQFSHITEFVRTTLASIRLLKAYTQERLQTARFDRLGRTYIRDNLRLAMVQGTLFPVAGLVGNLSLLLILYFGGRFTIQERITAGDFVAFMTYLAMLTWPMMALGWVANLFQRGVTSLARIRELLDERPALVDSGRVRTGIKRLKGRVTVSDLHFTYAGRTAPALAGVSLDLTPGIWGLVGRTGCGKTTLCQLLARVYALPRGVLFYDGIDVNDLSLAAVRSSIAYVPQNMVLFSDTVAANIAMGCAEAGREEIEDAARAAVIHDEIMAMEKGYATRIGERGVKLSGGQRQRIALARALLLDRPLFILDDGLSAVDMETEQTIIRSIGAYLKGRTCLIVSHRVAPLIDADTILVMEQGRIVAQGAHGRLLVESPYYAAIFHHQQAGTTGEG
ncbi:MAG: ABC transporter ATP-binding protein/permease [Desulfobacterales bacterium]|nr:ABC transporter ATP-binding protein/permease [Desulfobacterales bacterium]